MSERQHPDGPSGVDGTDGVDGGDGADGLVETDVRRGLRARAARAEVDDARAAALVSAVGTRVRRRRQRVTVGLAVAVVAAVVLGTVGVTRWAGSGGGVGAPADGTRGTDSPSEVSTQEWRTEYWKGVQVEVPGDWVLGPAPAVSGGRQGPPVICGGLPEVGYVGRPILASQVCVARGVDERPSVPSLWFDAAGVDVGTVDLGGGWVRETVELAGARVSVTAQDDGLRAAVLGTLDRGDLCDAILDGVPEPRLDWTLEGRGDLARAQLCAYRDLGSGRPELVWAGELAPSTWQATRSAVADAPRSRTRCGAPDELVVVTGWFDDDYGAPASLREDIVHDLGCGTVTVSVDPLRRPTTEVHALTEATVPWAPPSGPFNHLLVGPAVGGTWVYGRFIGVGR